MSGELMANFLPMKNYILYCLNQLINQYNLKTPFLDIGCGNGDISRFVAAKKWHGKAIDISQEAICRAQEELADFKGVSVELKSFFEEKTFYKTIFVIDVLEHLEDDYAALEKIYSLLNQGGHVIFSIPSNPREWRWDDNFYGHYRRYTREEIRKKLLAVGLEPLVFWDFTYPVFWIMRRLYTRLKSVPHERFIDKTERTKMSSLRSSWNIPVLSSLLSRDFFIWKVVYTMQFTFFKKKVEKGHGMIVLARKTN